MTFKVMILTFAAALSIGGCSAGPQPLAKEEMQKSFDNAKVVRGIYDANGGNYETLSEGDKKTLIDIYKSDEGVKKAFEAMKNPPGGMGSSPMPGGPQQQGK
jgi:hypothetical protein